MTWEGSFVFVFCLKRQLSIVSPKLQKYCVPEIAVAPPAEEADLDGDSDIDRNDLMTITSFRNQPASSCPECDLDGDGVITGLDARKAVLLCTLPGCAVP